MELKRFELTILEIAEQLKVSQKLLKMHFIEINLQIPKKNGLNTNMRICLNLVSPILKNCQLFKTETFAQNNNRFSNQ
jgi:hypothetical protein